MVYSLVGILLCLSIENSIGAVQPVLDGHHEALQKSFWEALGFTHKRPLRGDKDAFWAVRGKRSVDQIVQDDMLDEENSDESQIDAENSDDDYIDAIRRIIQDIELDGEMDENEAIELLHYLLVNHHFEAPQKRGGLIKPNGLFGAIGGLKRSIIKPNGMFTTLMKRSLKPNGLFSISGKRMSLKPNGLFAGKRSSFKPNSLFNIPGKRGSFKPNGLFNIPTKRTLKPNGLFLFKRVFKPNGLFTPIKRGGLKPNGLFNAYKRAAMEEDLVSALRDSMMKKDKGFWAVRGKKSDDFWAVRGKKDDDFWAVRGKKSAENNEEADNGEH